jgi:hypothetical protein
MDRKYNVSASCKRVLLEKVANLIHGHDGRASVNDILLFSHEAMASDSCEMCNLPLDILSVKTDHLFCV